jgi:hypothetical protein
VTLANATRPRLGAEWKFCSNPAIGGRDMNRAEEIKEAEKEVQYWSKRVINSTTEMECASCERYLRAARYKLETLRQSGPWRP